MENTHVIIIHFQRGFLMGASFYLYSLRLKLELYLTPKSIIMHSGTGVNRSIPLVFGGEVHN